MQIFDTITNELLPSILKSSTDIEALQIYLILPLYHEFKKSQNYKLLHVPFINALLDLKLELKETVLNWWAITDVEWFENLVICFKNVAIYIFSFKILHREVNCIDDVILVI